jgi:acyl dehydratase
MRIPAGIVGTTVGPDVQEIDARWLMAYAAALGETAPEYFDTTRPAGILAHPLFPVCYEWPLALELRATALSAEIAVRSVHATHDLRLHRPPRPGDRLRTTATIVSAEPRPPGAYILTRFETVDAEGRPVTTTDYGSIYRGVECEEPPPSRPRDPDPAPRDARPDWSVSVPIAANLAHVYSECARIWNPIHTDRAVARAAGLPDIILHGTATLALAVSAILRREPAGAAAAITRVACRFSAMVRLPSTIVAEGRNRAGDGVISFQVLTSEGRAALLRGSIVRA